MDFRVRQLEYFLVLADKLNFRKAASALNIAQPTLSFQIQSLEGSVGATLFDRSQREVRLTPEGERLRIHAKAILSHARMAMNAVQGHASSPLKISCGPVGRYSVLPDILRQLAERKLNISLEVVSLSPEKMKEAAVNGDVDMLLMTPNWALPGMEYARLREDRLAAVLPEKHPAVRRGWITVKEFCDSRVMVMAAKDCHKHREFVSGLMAKHGQQPELLEVSFADGIHYAMVAAGRGVALAAGSIASANFPGVRVVPFDQILHNMELGMMWHKGNESHALASFIELVNQVVQTQDEAAASLPAMPARIASVTSISVA
jgi:DNA-binding transcriptional LysR family regulator